MGAEGNVTIAPLKPVKKVFKQETGRRLEEFWPRLAYGLNRVELNGVDYIVVYEDDSTDWYELHHFNVPGVKWVDIHNHRHTQILARLIEKHGTTTEVWT